MNQNKIELSKANKHLELRVFERTKELEEANQAKTEFLSSMSHELRTPMNAILGFSQLLEIDESLQAKQKASVNEIISAGNHLLGLINEVLNLSMVEQGKHQLKIEDTNITKIVNESLATLSPIAEKSNIQLINNIKADYFIHTDNFRLKQVIINLLSNAIKYNHAMVKFLSILISLMIIKFAFQLRIQAQV